MLAEGIKKIYLIGIKGTGMSSLAVILKKMGYEVTGSDTSETFFTETQLRYNDIKFFEGFNEAHIRSVEPDLVIVSTAYNERNKEVSEAKLLRYKILSYPEALGAISEKLHSVAICGSHGKTTTTSMLGTLMQTNNQTVTLTGTVAEHLINEVEKPKFFVFEADEYQDKLQYYHPREVILTNVDYDHPDFFKDKEQYNQTYQRFIEKTLKANGYVLYNYDDAQAHALAQMFQGGIESYGFDPNATYQLTNVSADLSEASITRQDKELLKLKLSVYGKHNLLNAAASAIMAYRLGISAETIETTLPTFTGVKRRMELIPSDKYIIIDDYGHHPTEIKATLSALRNHYPTNHIVAVFHPHTFTRTKALLQDFAASFGDVNQVIVLDIYPSARETVMDDVHPVQGNPAEGSASVTSGRLSLNGVHSQDMVREINKHQQNAIYQPTIPDAAEYIQKNIPQGSVIITIGAGDVWKLCNLIK